MSSSVFTQQNTLEKVSGIVKRITFHSVETGWTVLKVSLFDRSHEEVAVTVLVNDLKCERILPSGRTFL